MSINFISLANRGFYDKTMFHRIDKGFVIQAGDNNTKSNGSSIDIWGNWWSWSSIKEDFTDIPHKRGIVSMARAAEPNSAGSQFFVVHNDLKFLDNQYTVFGRVTDGMDVVDNIASINTFENDKPVDP